MCSSKLFGPVIVYPTDTFSQTKPINSKSCYKIPFESTCTLIISRRVRRQIMECFISQESCSTSADKGQLVSQLVGALILVNHRGLHQGQLVGALILVNHRGLHQGYIKAKQTNEKLEERKKRKKKTKCDTKHKASGQR